VRCADSAVCLDGSCAERLGVGASCPGEAPCVLGADCRDGRCAFPELVAVGDACDAARRCPYAAACVGGRCRAQAPGRAAAPRAAPRASASVRHAYRSGHRGRVPGRRVLLRRWPLIAARPRQRLYSLTSGPRVHTARNPARRPHRHAPTPPRWVTWPPGGVASPPSDDPVALALLGGFFRRARASRSLGLPGGAASARAVPATRLTRRPVRDRASGNRPRDMATRLDGGRPERSKPCHARERGPCPAGRGRARVDAAGRNRLALVNMAAAGGRHAHGARRWRSCRIPHAEVDFVGAWSRPGGPAGRRHDDYVALPDGRGRARALRSGPGSRSPAAPVARRRSRTSSPIASASRWRASARVPAIHLRSRPPPALPRLV
jgi:hypothetical protein